MDLSVSTSLAAIAIALGGFLIHHKYKQHRDNPDGLPYPPGPKRLPIVGCALEMPATLPWFGFAELAKKYGDIMYFDAFGQPIIIINSSKVVGDLFEKRASKYSSRSHSPMLMDVMGLDFILTMKPFNEEWKATRREFHSNFNASKISKFNPVQERQARVALVKLLEDPKDYVEHIRLAIISTIVQVTYGIEVTSAQDEYVVIADEAVHKFNEALQPGRFLVDFFPLLFYVPAWFPGAGFQNFGRKMGEQTRWLMNSPFQRVKDAVTAGEAQPSVIGDMLQNLPERGNRAEQEKIIKEVGAIAYLAGFETLLYTMQFFFLAMVQNSEVVKKAHDQLDKAIGHDHLPTVKDRAELPYIEAVVKEVLRWQPVVPLAVPHYTTESDEYNGYYIPKGAIVMGNVWSILHDPVEYPEPELFKPERFLHPDGSLNDAVQDPSIACFGFGRRICPGQPFANDVLFTLVASILHTFDITTEFDANGKPIPAELEFVPAGITSPKPFPCSIKPRSANAESLIHTYTQH